MDKRQLYITRPPEGEELYTELQRQTLTELQRLSGEVWTDYNSGDPGVTIADAANYALTEIDYKLNFAPEDYLSRRSGVSFCAGHGRGLPPGDTDPFPDGGECKGHT